MKLNSSDFEDGGDIPLKFTCQGEGISPTLSWSEIPAGAKSLALSLVDPDAPGGNFIHWLIINIPASASGI
ncbi:YbhB/YbcL family Raf kinase inhibitor-like protein, partial [Candidatus Berkelbacteria bacterium CG23_combo_of_CG06-09_8_20_14_all_41_73]